MKWSQLTIQSLLSGEDTGNIFLSEEMSDGYCKIVAVDDNGNSISGTILASELADALEQLSFDF